MLKNNVNVNRVTHTFGKRDSVMPLYFQIYRVGKFSKKSSHPSDEALDEVIVNIKTVIVVL